MKRLVIKNRDGIKEKIQCYFSGNEESKFIHRLHGILLFAEKEDESCESIGSLFGNSPRTVSNWIKRINESGDIESLRSKKQSGRPSRLSEAQCGELRAILQEAPEKHGITSNIWDGKSLSAYILMRYGVVLQIRACQRLYHKLGFSLKRARPTAAQGDPVKKAESKKNFKRK